MGSGEFGGTKPQQMPPDVFKDLLGTLSASKTAVESDDGFTDFAGADVSGLSVGTTGAKASHQSDIPHGVERDKPLDLAIFDDEVGAGPRCRCPDLLL